MTKSLSKKRIVKPPLDRFGGVRIVQKRIQKSEILHHSKDAVAQELVDIATSSIDEIILDMFVSKVLMKYQIKQSRQ